MAESFLLKMGVATRLTMTVIDLSTKGVDLEIAKHTAHNMRTVNSCRYAPRPYEHNVTASNRLLRVLRQISDKLGKGFSLAALQKSVGCDTELGGERGLEKLRLYLAMDSGWLKIVKAKAWADPHTNLNGMTIESTLADGCKFRNTRAWQK